MYLEQNLSRDNDYILPGNFFYTKYIMSRYITISPDKVFAVMEEWLYDNDNLVINIIAILFFLKCYKTPTYKFELIPFSRRSQDTPEQQLRIKHIFTFIVALQPKYLNEVTNQWRKQGVFTLRVLSDTFLFILYITPLIPKIFRSMTDLKAKLQAIGWLIRIQDYRKEMIEEILTLLREDKLPERIVGELTPYVLHEEYFDMIVPVLVKYIGSEGYHQIREECIPVLFQFGSNETKNLILAKNLVIFQKDPYFHFPVLINNHFILALSMLQAKSEAYKILCDMIPFLLKKDSKIWYPITLHLCRREPCEYKRQDKIKWIKWGLENLPVKTQCTIVILLLDLEIIKDERIIFDMIKPTILETLHKSEQFYDAVMKKCVKKKHVRLIEDVVNDLEFKVIWRY